MFNVSLAILSSAAVRVINSDWQSKYDMAKIAMIINSKMHTMLRQNIVCSSCFVFIFVPQISLNQP